MAKNNFDNQLHPSRCVRRSSTKKEMFMKTSFYSFLILSLNTLYLIEATNIYDAIVSSFEEDGHKVFCVLMLTFENQAFAQNDVPIVAVNISDPKVDLKNSCKNYVIALRTLQDMKQLDRKQFRVKIRLTFLINHIFKGIFFISDSLVTLNLQLSFKKR